MTSASERKDPSWWKQEHSSSWERTKAALRRDWEQTKADVSDGGRELNQDAGDTIKQATGKQPIPDGPNPPESWEEAESAIRYGHGAAFHYSGREWNDDLERDLRKDWDDDERSGTWQRVKAAVRRGWESAKLTAASTNVPLI